ncbi:type I restriction enzyme HsdR N-terminal domain-containing protein [Thiospirillum jenense]|uniref:Type I restriction enzyme HsdR N-terminal domain-containing protein n=1 Tax=Thiospirillum jenense TaxID=1653858 RepID=A0A839HI61_9GAMM|nr:type I restriction enzyme HsdR N-terminal domain-containing protein [Thiospirillum jenense]
MNQLFEHFDFAQLDSPDFKEDSVREVLILPLLKQLGYEQPHIVRSKSLIHPFLKIGSQKRPIKLIPDYLLKVSNNYAWVLDAKAPNENIQSGDNVEQVYSYSIHPEVRSTFFALCNGRAFALFRQDVTKPILYFQLKDIAQYWDDLYAHLAPSAFQMGKRFVYSPPKSAINTAPFDYLSQPLLEEITVKKRAAKRHFGVHGYFTKQAWNVVNQYIAHFSQPGDLVLDSFGGSGITAIEAMMLDRRAIHLDLNPMSAFLVDSLTHPVDLDELKINFEQIKFAYLRHEPISEDAIEKALKKYPYPKDFVLPKGSDVQLIQDLFSKKQLAQLGFLKHLILKKSNKNTQKPLLLAFSSTLNKLNLTYHHSTYATKNAGDSSPMRYYRYRIAPACVDLDLLKTYEKKFSAVVNAKLEIADKINQDTIANLQVMQGTATDLSFLKKESVDYIYTDPPYGKKIPYLDLSVMWNAWLELPVTEQDYALEAIEGGEHEKSKADYNALIAKSIAEMYRVLKFDRWMSFVFAHKDPEFWHLIIETAERCGFEYVGAVAQKNGQTSFKKRQNPFTVLSGQLIINFRKVRRPKYIMKASLGMDIGDIVIQTVEGVIAKYQGATLEQINDELIIKGLELGFLDLLKKQYSDLTPLLLELFDFDKSSECFTIKANKSFTTQIDLHLRVRYYLISYLRRMERENKSAIFDDIVFAIMPLLKNGVTPESQTILSVLEDIAYCVGDGWRLKADGQATLLLISTN